MTDREKLLVGVLKSIVDVLDEAGKSLRKTIDMYEDDPKNWPVADIGDNPKKPTQIVDYSDLDWVTGTGRFGQ